MELYKKILFKLFKILPITAGVAIVIGCIVLLFLNDKPTQLTEKEFIDKAIENHISSFAEYDNTFVMDLDSGKRYAHEFKSYEQASVFKDLIMEKFGTISTGSSYYETDYNQYYLGVIGGTICVAFSILLFYVTVVLWFVSLFDLLKSEFIENHNKWMWLICLLLLPFISPLFYAFIASKQKRPVNLAQQNLK
ncbi:hypothetical protein AM493_08320 [Flavobacterium akiainvivens]|uniref:Cardiolipin synthase N-terminal domain-containing protein n=1 Tax=Flavobacterium akiainvivens TaxID=1202724 RepID=A0A0M8M917_9FLAO|nr:PLD nuclease N-terminal domain-containing protein [Flavobacterium akiainvivens]KOS06043.1 hypothetical protein AM493_08320 [Flavobacterium akiainvivens]SFQ54483.1 Phospholipase_D-nuclease N-terminal [Flavobacterium akiainvivens]